MRAKGLCFKCKQPYSPLHECPSKSLMTIIAGEDEFSIKGEFIKIKGDGEQKLKANLIEAHFSKLELSMYSVGEIQRPDMMKFRGVIDKNHVVVLIDSGANHTFVSSDLVQQMNFSITKTPTFNVKLGDGCRVSSSEICKRLQM